MPGNHALPGNRLQLGRYSPVVLNWVYPLTTELEVAITETVIPDYENIYLYEILPEAPGIKNAAVEVEALFSLPPPTGSILTRQ